MKDIHDQVKKSLFADDNSIVSKIIESAQLNEEFAWNESIDKIKTLETSISRIIAEANNLIDYLRKSRIEKVMTKRKSEAAIYNKSFYSRSAQSFVFEISSNEQDSYC